MKKFRWFVLGLLVSILASCTTAPRPEDTAMINRLKTQLTDFQNQITVKEAVVADLTQKLIALQDDSDLMHKLQEQLALLQKQDKDKDAVIAGLTAGDAKLQALMDRNNQLQAQVVDLTAKLAQATKANQALTAQKAATDAQLAKMSADVGQYQARLGALGKVNSDLSAQTGQKDASLADLQAKLDAAAKDNVDLAAKVDALKSGSTQTQASYLSQINALNKEKAQLQSRITALEKQVAELKVLSQKDLNDLNARVAELKTRFAKEIAAGEIEIKRYRNVLVIEVKDSVLFPPDSPSLLVANTGILLTIADVIKRAPDGILRVEGNTAVAISSPETLRLYPTSWHLGAARAANVVSFLQEKGLVDPTQLVASSLGEYSPVADNGTELGKSQNRRVEFVLVARELWQIDRLNGVTQ
jgi:chemotaxis protein MotB